jgi:hypothetical protein
MRGTRRLGQNSPERVLRSASPSPAPQTGALVPPVSAARESPGPGHAHVPDSKPNGLNCGNVLHHGPRFKTRRGMARTGSNLADHAPACRPCVYAKTRQAARMSSLQKRRTGRRPIGQPETVWGRVSVEVRRQVDELSDQLGIPKARVVATLIDVGLDHLAEAQFPQGKPPEEELPMSNAS